MIRQLVRLQVSGSGEEHPRLNLRLRARQGPSRDLRRGKNPVYASNNIQAGDDFDSDVAPFLDSDLPGRKRRRTKLRLRGASQPDHFEVGIGYDKSRRSRPAERQSGRSTRHTGGMEEVGGNEIYRSDSDGGTREPAKPKVIGAREQFQTPPRNDEFRLRHLQDCETCGRNANFGRLIYC